MIFATLVLIIMSTYQYTRAIGVHSTMLETASGHTAASQQAARLPVVVIS